jgi:hypothetical protein
MVAQASTGIMLPDGTLQSVQTYCACVERRSAARCPTADASVDGETLTKSADLKTNACACSAAPPTHVRLLLSRVPAPVLARFYGCGSPLPLGCEGLRVLDLGCGSGRYAHGTMCSSLA